ncbi:MAG TPA: amino acid adenylation domain-containing protein, partial [Pyrinomonadaceae bacterium]|nr:amino acid adenylation domain-containing protein [Pyrinomonadaceae bacterium]
MLQHWENLLTGIVNHPTLPLSQLPLLSEAESDQLLYEWNDTQTAIPSTCIHQLFEQQVELTPDAIALNFEGEQLSYLELNRRANQLAHFLLAQGVGAETLVGLCVERSVEMVVGMLGVLKAGGAYVPLDVEYPAERLQYMLEDAAVNVLLTQQHLIKRLPPHNAKVVCLDTGWQEIGSYSAASVGDNISESNLAYVIYTSGSTGWPKGVMVTHCGFHSLHRAQADTFSISSDDRVLQFSSLSFDASVFEIIMALLNGATLYLAAAESLLPGPALHRLLQDAEITQLTIPPSCLAVLPTDNLPHLHSLVVAGERCPGQLVQQWNGRRRFFNGYGPTEASICTTLAECRADGEAPPIGQPIINVQVYVLDEQMQPVPVGITGELYIGGASLARGYLNRPHLTAERFVPHPFSNEPGARLYRSGDLVRWRLAPTDEGELEYVGRIDEQVKVRGYRIEIGEVETVLRSHPAVSSCVVIAREEEGGERRLVAYVVSAEGEERTKISELRRYMGEKLPEYMIPSVFIELEELPLTVNGKVDRRALPAPTGERMLPEEEFAAPRTGVEEYLSQIWSEVLGVDKVGIHDNFFELGGHSLLATQVMSRVNECFELGIPLRRLFEEPTVYGLASSVEAEISADRNVQLPPIKPVPREENLRLSYAQQRLWFIDQLEPGSALYNVPLAIRLSGQLHPQALAASFTELVRRHEVLRTTFAHAAGEPVQVIAAASPISLPVIDLSALDIEQAETMAQALFSAEAAGGFDLQEGPLMRVRLLKLTASEHVMLLTLHHIICDGWSMG